MPGGTRKITAAALILALGAAAAQAGESARRQTVLGAAASRLVPGAWTEIATKGHRYGMFKVRDHHVFEYTDDAVWHPASQTWLFIGQGHISPPLKFLTYSARSNAWQAMPIPPWAIGLKWGHAYDNNAIDAKRGVFYHHQSESWVVHAYDIAGRTWRTLPQVKAFSHAHGTALAFFPEMDALVRVLAATSPSFG